jgi:hypothetical protein
MKKILILLSMFVLVFGFVSCSKDGNGGGSGVYTVQINFFVPDPSQPTTVPVGEGARFSVTVTENGKPIDSDDVDVSTFKDSGIGNLRIWNDGEINIQGAKISKKYGEIKGCRFGAVSGSGNFGLTATYKGVTASVTFKTN